MTYFSFFYGKKSSGHNVNRCGSESRETSISSIEEGETQLLPHDILIGYVDIFCVQPPSEHWPIPSPSTNPWDPAGLYRHCSLPYFVSRCAKSVCKAWCRSKSRTISRRDCIIIRCKEKAAIRSHRHGSLPWDEGGPVRALGARKTSHLDNWSRKTYARAIMRMEYNSNN